MMINLFGQNLKLKTLLIPVCKVLVTFWAELTIETSNFCANFAIKPLPKVFRKILVSVYEIDKT